MLSTPLWYRGHKQKKHTQIAPRRNRQRSMSNSDSVNSKRDEKRSSPAEQLSTRKSNYWSLLPLLTRDHRSQVITWLKKGGYSHDLVCTLVHTNARARRATEPPSTEYDHYGSPNRRFATTPFNEVMAWWVHHSMDHTRCWGYQTCDQQESPQQDHSPPLPVRYHYIPILDPG